jgi:hypothetical protein
MVDEPGALRDRERGLRDPEQERVERLVDRVVSLFGVPLQRRRGDTQPRKIGVELGPRMRAFRGDL